LEKYREEIAACIKCGKCNATCPTLVHTTDESIGPRGRVAIISAILKGRIKLNRRVEKKLSACLSCLACNETCPNEVNPADIIMAAREEIADTRGVHKGINRGTTFILKRMGRISYLAKISSYLARVYNLIPNSGFLGKLLPYADNKGKRLFPLSMKKEFLSQYPKTISPDKPIKRVGYFVGCTTNLIFQSEGEALISLLKKMGVEIVIPPEQTCCGAPSYHLGDIEGTRKLAEKNIAIFGKDGLDEIVTSCATCGHMLKKIYPEISNGTQFGAKMMGEKIIDINRFIVEQINERGLTQKVSDRTRIKVTYHDPCHLRRGLQILEEPREILKGINWIEYVEMEDADSCCGGSGLFSLKHYDLSKKIGKTKVEAILKTGAEIVATSCPSCKMQLEDMLRREGSRIKVYHTVELLNEAIEN
ncbi:MAG: (Fe-S)-binding protein, partial [Nitrospinota bacterium]